MEADRYHDHWVMLLAERTIMEITDLMVGLRLSPAVPDRAAAGARPRMDGVIGIVRGEGQLRLCFLAEPRFFDRLARRMSGEALEDRELIREYASEYVNTIYGRFVGNLFQSTHRRLRGFTLDYEQNVDPEMADRAVCLRSEAGETVLFFWGPCRERDMPGAGVQASREQTFRPDFPEMDRR